MTTIDSNPIQVGLTSYGMSGMVFHAPLLASDPRYVLTHVLERRSERAKQHFPEVTIVKDFDALIQNSALELIVINTPNALHYEMARQALEAGKHVVIEKPFTVTTWEAEALIKLAQQQNRVLTVFQNRRWDGDFLTVQQVVSKKLLGRLVEYEAHYDRFVNEVRLGTWKEADGPGSGILYNLGSHMIDQALVLFGRPKAVTASVGAFREGSEIDDFYDITLHFEGVKAVLKSSYLVREPGPRYVLHGTTGSFVKYGIDPQEEALKAGLKPGENDWGKEAPADWGKFNGELEGLHYTGNIETLPGDYPAFYANLYEVIREGKALAVKAEEAALVIKLIELAMQSSKEGRTLEV